MTRAERLAIALHEAGHAVVAAALGTAPTAATVTDAGGVVSFKARQPRAAVALDREGEALGMLVWLTIAGAGGAAAALRFPRRPRARLGELYRAAAFSSCADAAVAAAAEARLAELGICATEGAIAAHGAATGILERHAATVARVAAALYRRGRLDAAALAELLAPAACCAASREALALAALALCDAFPSPPRGCPPAPSGQPSGREDDT